MNFEDTIRAVAKKEWMTHDEMYNFACHQWGMIIAYIKEKNGYVGEDDYNFIAGENANFAGYLLDHGYKQETVENIARTGKDV